MSATPTEPTTTEPTAPAAQPEPPKVQPPAQEIDWKTEARKWEDRAKANAEQAKANAEAAKKLAEIEEANKSDAEKLAARAEAAEARAAKAEREAFAATKGVPVSLVTGSTPEEWEASVTAALEWRGEVAKPLPAAPSSAGQGNVGEPVGAGVKQLTRMDLANMSPTQIEAARESGQLSDLLTGKTT